MQCLLYVQGVRKVTMQLLGFRLSSHGLSAWLDELFEQKPIEFYKSGIENLVECWEEIVNNKREYIIGQLVVNFLWI